MTEHRLIGVGLYTIPEVARLARIPLQSVRRWALGYTWRGQHSGPVIRPQLDPVDGAVVLTFRDMLELRFLHAFRAAGVSWPLLHLAAQRAREIIGHAHPFSTGRFRSAGNSILTEVAHQAGEPALLHIVERQLAFKRILAPYLRGVEFKAGEPIRWFPTDQRIIVVDPARSFGQPVLFKEGVPTRILARALQAEGSMAAVARWYEVSVPGVKAAVRFERRLAAA